MADNLSGRAIRGYELREQVGLGGFGAVYRAYQPLLKREVAIKVILPQYANSPDFIRRFEVEAELVARLEHPYIVPLFDYWREPDSAYLVMRLLKGGTLRDLIDEGNVSLETVATILDQITAALHISHRNGVVHRDIKPRNILLDEDGNAYLTDFGIAQSVDYDSLTGEEVGISGSIPYTPPEQLQGGKIVPETDVYAMGIILYELIMGEHPFEQASITEMVFKQISDPLPEIDVDEIPYNLNDILQKATAKASQDRYADVRDLAREFRTLISGGNVFTPTPVEEALIDVNNPYKGLRAFQEADAEQFFGRSALTERLLDRLSEPTDGGRFLAVIGPSGSGKSSVVKAGLLPAIRQGRLRGSENWFIAEMFPGISPFYELESALMRVAINPIESLIQQVENENGFSDVIQQILPDDDSELLLVIDQFEEIFTQVTDEETRTRFLNNLVESIENPQSRLRIIVTMRADFYDKPLQYREFGELLRKRLETVLPMSPDELRETITQPAELVGITFQEGLVETISQDVGQQAGMLPLLQYTMTELFDNRQGNSLTLNAYQEIGGVTGSLARRSEEIYSGLDNVGRQATRQLFLRLVSLGEGTEDTRRRVRQSELATNTAIDDVINIYGKYRLLTFDKDPASREPTVEVAHEALIRTWRRLRAWINENREDLRVQQRVSGAVNEWLSSNKDNSYLASGARLTQFDEWREQTQLVLNADEQTYITASIDAEAARKAQEVAIAKRVQNFQRASIVLGVMVVLAIIATGIFLTRATQAQNQVAQAISTLTPAQATVIFAQTQARGAEVEVEAASVFVETAQAQVDFAQVQLDSVGSTLTPIQSTVQAGDALLATRQADLADAQAQAAQAQTQVGNAETQVAVQQELTLVAPTIAAADERVASLVIQIESVGATLTPARATIDAAENQAILAQSTIQAAQTEVNLAQNEADIAQTQVSQAQMEAESAQADAVVAQTEAGIAQGDANIAQTEAGVAQGDAVVAQTEAGIAQADANIAQTEVNIAQAEVALVGQTLTPVILTVAAGEQQLSTQQSDLVTAQALAGNAQTQAAVVQQLTIIAPTIASADERVANLEAEIQNVGATLTPVQATVQAAQAQIANVGLTLTPIQEEIVRSQAQASTAQAQAVIVQREADSISLAVSAEQAVDVGNYDLALALTFESLNLNSNQTRARRILNDIAFGTARLSFANTAVSALSPDNRYFVTAEGNDLLVWDVNSRILIERLTGHSGAILSVDFSLDSSLLATGSSDATVRVWDVSAWRNNGLAVLQAELAQHTAAINVVRFGLDPNNPTIFSGSDDSDIIQWNARNGSVIRSYTGNSWSVVDLRFVGDGNNFFTTVDANGTPILLYWNSGNTNPTFTEQSLIFDNYNADATRATIGGSGGRNLEVYNSTRRSSVRPFNSRDFNWATETATAVAFSPDGREVLIGISSAQADNRLVLVDIASGAVVRTFVGQLSQRVDVLAFSPDGTLALSANDTGLVLWDVLSGTALRTLAAHTDIITDIDFSADGRFAVSRSRDNNVRLWDIAGGDEALRQIFTIETAVNSGKAPGFNSRGDQVIVSSLFSIFNWNLQSGQRNEVVSPGGEIINVVYSPTQAQAISVQRNVAISWNLDLGVNGLIRRFGDNESQFTGIAAYSPNGEFIALDEDRRILIYEISTGGRNTINKPQLDDGLVITNIAVSSDGQYVVGSTGVLNQVEANAGDIILWETATGQELHRFPAEHVRNINWLEFSADGTRVLSASDDNTLILWDVSVTEAIVRRRFAGHTDDVNVGLFVPNDGLTEQFILSGSDDRSMIIWDIDSGQALRTFRGSPAPITGLALSSDGQQMVTSYGRLGESRDELIAGLPETVIYVWELTRTEELIEWTARNRYIRDLTPAECEQYRINNCNGQGGISMSSNPAPVIAPTLDTNVSNTNNDTAQAPATASPVASQAQVTNSGSQSLNVRSSDSTTASVVASLQVGEQAVILGRSTGDTRWYQIQLNDGRVGWVREDIVSTQGDVSALVGITPPVVAQVQATTAPNPVLPTESSAANSGTAQGNLQITGMGLNPSSPNCAEAFVILINVQNTGTEATASDATVFVSDRHGASGVQQAQGSGTVPILTPGQNWVVSVNLTVSTFFAEQHEIVAQVDSLGVVTETNEDDNFFTTSYTLNSGTCG